MKSFLHLKPTRAQFIAVAIIFTSMGLSYAAVTIPNTFTASTPAVADQVNANFTALKTAVDALEAKVNTLGTNLPLASKQGKMGYVWASDENLASYTPNPIYSFNSSGGAITAARSAIGVYSVTFSGLGGGGGHVQVTAYSTAAYCRTDGWSSPGTDVVIFVACFDSLGAAVDSLYDVLFVS